MLRPRIERIKRMAGDQVFIENDFRFISERAVTRSVVDLDGWTARMLAYNDGQTYKDTSPKDDRRFGVYVGFCWIIHM